MRNKTIESTIDQVIDEIPYGDSFKKVFKQFIKNKFDNNVSEGDLKRILTYIDIEEIEEDNSNENVDH